MTGTSSSIEAHESDRDPSAGELVAQLDRVRLESDTLYGVISVIASSPDLDRVLDGIVDVLTKATRCHACFIYLRTGERLRLRAASRVYAHLVGEIEFGVDQGLAGWALRHNRPAFIRENALDDPRTNYVPQLEEERFQSIAAVPVPTRGGDPMGVIVLHTIAPREFDEGTLNVLVHAAPLVAGVIENAQLFEDARSRVEALTRLAELGQAIAAVDRRRDLYRVAASGVRRLLACDEVRLYEMDADRQRLQMVASDPTTEHPPPGHASATAVLVDLLRRRTSAGGRADGLRGRGTPEALELDVHAEHVLVAPVTAGDDHLGVLVAASERPPSQDADELLRAVANQVAVALKKADLIARLTEENIVRNLFEALESGRVVDAQARAADVGWQPERAHVFVHVEDARVDDVARAWPRVAKRCEASLRRTVPGAMCDTGTHCVRALLPLESGAIARELQSLDDALAEIGSADQTVIGRSNVHRGAERAPSGMREAADAARVAHALARTGGALAYSELGAYRYLVHLATDDAPHDPYLEAVRTITEYDRRRGSQLMATLEKYLDDRRSVTESARALMVHPNTLRQRLERIEKLTGLDLAAADLLALELAVKLSRLRPPGG